MSIKVTRYLEEEALNAVRNAENGANQEIEIPGIPGIFVTANLAAVNGILLGITQYAGTRYYIVMKA